MCGVTLYVVLSKGDIVKAFLTMWDEVKEKRKTQIVDCPTLIVHDGVEIDIEGEKSQLFNVVSANKIYQHVAVIEIL